MRHDWMHYCNKCGKTMYPTPGWIYKRGSKYYCSWKCYRECVNKKPKRKVILPKVGDTIRIIRVPTLPTCSDKVGVVEFYDTMGQLHGTWGWWVIIPGVDTYEIIGESNDERIL